MTRILFPFDAYQGQRVLVLGAAGFLGRWVGRLLTDCRSNLFLVVRDHNRAQNTFSRYRVEGETIVADLAAPGVVEKLISEIRPAIIFNLAGYGVDRLERHKKIAFQLNERLPSLLCRAASHLQRGTWNGQSIVHAGSGLEYGKRNGLLTEETEPGPGNVYGASKLAGTLAVQAAARETGGAFVTARIFNVYGPGEHQGRLLPSLLEVACNGGSLPLTEGTQQHDFTYVEEVAEGLLRLGASRAEPGQIVNLATGRLQSVRRFVKVAARLLKIDDSQLQFGKLSSRAENERRIRVDVTKLSRLTGWRPTLEIREGVLKTMQFYQLKSELQEHER